MYPVHPPPSTLVTTSLSTDEDSWQVFVYGWTMTNVAVEIRMRTLYRKFILRKWRLKFTYDFDVMRWLRCRLPIVYLQCFQWAFDWSLFGNRTTLHRGEIVPVRCLKKRKARALSLKAQALSRMAQALLVRAQVLSRTAEALFRAQVLPKAQTLSHTVRALLKAQAPPLRW